VQAHLRRLYDGLQALDIKLDLTPHQVAALLRRCIDANGMRSADGATVRLLVSRGLKRTPTYHPETTVGAPTLAIIPEWTDTMHPARDTVRP
jgi:branched-chain amino acid aminotransferase